MRHSIGTRSDDDLIAEIRKRPKQTARTHTNVTYNMCLRVVLCILFS